MRTICRFAGLAALLSCLLAPLASADAKVMRLLPANGKVSPADASPGNRSGSRDGGHRATAAAWLEEADEIATLEAIRYALSEVGDGGSYVWYRQNGRLNGIVHPTASFKDGHGRVCRHIVLILSAGAQDGRAEGIACRDIHGRWLLEG